MFSDESTLSRCSDKLNIPQIIFVNTQTKTITNSSNPNTSKIELDFFIPDQETYDKVLNNAKVREDPAAVLDNLTVRKKFLGNDLDQIKEEFEECKNLQYFIYVALFNIRPETGGHANLLLLNKDDKRVTWIEPQYDQNITERNKKLITNVIVKLLKHLGIPPNEYTIDLPKGQCPQAITQDTNCMFWTFLLTVFLVFNPKSTIDEVRSAIIKKYPTKELLSKYVESFKADFFYRFRDQIRKGGKRRRTIRRKPKNRKRTRKSI